MRRYRLRRLLTPLIFEKSYFFSPALNYSDNPYDSVNRRGEDGIYREADGLERSPMSRSTRRIIPPLYGDFGTNSRMSGQQRNYREDHQEVTRASGETRNKILRVKKSNAQGYL